MTRIQQRKMKGGKYLWRRRFFAHFFGIFLLFIVYLTQACSVSSNSAKDRPNVVLILIDALRPDKLGCYGFREHISPEIDELAGKGINFRRVLSQCSWTTPSVGSLLTSLYPRTLGLYRRAGNEILNDRFTTLPEILKSHNYLTIGITANPNLNTNYNFQQGFDHYVDSDIVWDWMKPQSGQIKFSKTSHQLKSASEVFKTLLGILDQDKKRPFFGYLHLMDVHASTKTNIRPEFRSLFDEYGRDEERTYYRKVRQVSFDVGNFVQTLLAKPGSENTLIIILADHGEGLFDHPDVPNSGGHGYLLYDSEAKVPLIFYHPNSSLKPRVIEQEVRLIDVMPTLLDYLKISRRPPDLVGKSLLPLVKGAKEKINLPKYFVAETRMNNLFKLAVYSKNYIYIENRQKYPEVNPRELQSRYRRQDGRRTDFINEHPEIAAAMEIFLKEWERKFPEGKITPSQKEASPETTEQLRSLGYIK
jgi:arylsulfatase A-like enzyme